MDVRWGFNLDQSTSRQLAALDRLIELTGGSTTSVHLGPLLVGPYENDVTLSHDMEDLQRAGLLSLRTPGVLQSWEASLTGQGVAEHEKLQGRRQSLRDRRYAARDAVLHFLDYTNNDLGQRSPHVIPGRMGGYGLFLGKPFSQAELDDARDWLEQQGLIRGGIRPDIEPKGEQVVASGQSVNDPQGSSPAAGATQYNFNAQVGNVAANSSNFTQQATVTGTPEQAEVIRGLAELIDLAQSRIAEVDESAGAIAGQVAADLQQAIAEGAPQPARLAGLLDKVTSLSATGAGGLAMVNALVFQALTLRQQLGLG